MLQQYKMKIKNKKAQFYIITAIVLIATVFLYSSTQTETPKQQNIFHEMSENYFNEAPYVLNSALLTSENMNEKMENFTRSFINYAKSRNIEMGIIYLYSIDNIITMGNFMEETATFENTDLFESTTAQFNLTTNFTVSLGDNIYYFNISNNEFKAIAKEYGEDYIKIELKR